MAENSSSRLLENGKEYRKILLPKNDYNQNNVYNSSHKDALSDGDERGRGELNGNVGTSKKLIGDIEKRDELLSKHFYNKNNMYDFGSENV